MIIFNEQEHSYKRDNKKYISVSQLIEKYFPKFEDSKEFWLYYKALQEEMGFPNNDFYKKEFAKYLIINHKLDFNKKNLNDLINIKNLELGKDVFIDIFKKSQEWKEENIKSQIKGNRIHKQKEDTHLQNKHTNEKVTKVISIKKELEKGIIKGEEIKNIEIKA